MQKGFDFTQVDAKRWEAFKKKYGITLVKKSPKGSKTHVFFSKKNCVVIVTNNEDKENYRNTYLSYVRFEAPKNKRSVLERMLRDFRGPSQLRDQDESLSCEGRRTLGQNCPAATYIKEEDAWAHPPLSYASFI